MTPPLLTALVDFLVALLAAFIVMVNEPVETKDAEAKAMCQLMVELHWGDALVSDVDLWVQAPGDVPVGYSNKGGRVFNLLRDDLGQPGDPTKQNFEISCTRGLPDGLYAVNLHLYRVSDPLPIEATVRVTARRDEGKQDVLTDSAVLTKLGEEVTVMRFEVKDELIVSGSQHRLPIGLRTQRPSGSPVVTGRPF